MKINICLYTLSNFVLIYIFIVIVQAKVWWDEFELVSVENSKNGVSITDASDIGFNKSVYTIRGTLEFTDDPRNGYDCEIKGFYSQTGSNQYHLLPYKMPRDTCCNLFDAPLMKSILEFVSKTSDIPKPTDNELYCNLLETRVYTIKNVDVDKDIILKICRPGLYKIEIIVYKKNSDEVSSLIRGIGNIQFIEADIVLGTIINDPSGELQPVMGHPPVNTSDITLEKFLTQILEFNRDKEESNRKGVKLDFKSIEVFEGSMTMLRSLWESMDYPVWINADIIQGPLNSNGTAVDPTSFLTGCKNLTSSTLSIGWTTAWGKDFTVGTYNDTHIDQMIDAIKDNKIINSNHSITFPVRAGIAAQSADNLHRLVKAVNEINDVTLTIWSSAGDAVNVDLLRKLIFSFGLDKVYVDVPEELSRQLDLGNAPGRASSLIHFGMITIFMLLTSFMFSNCQFS